MMKYCQKINLQEPQRKRNATANFVNLIRTRTVHVIDKGILWLTVLKAELNARDFRAKRPHSLN